MARRIAFPLAFLYFAVPFGEFALPWLMEGTANATIAGLAARSAPEMRWTEAFAQLGNTQVESRFADHRTYIYEGKEVDQQTHLGFDLASTQQAPVTASNAYIPS